MTGWASSGQEDSPKEQSAGLVKRAKKAVNDSKNADAYLYYSEAAALQPNNKKLKTKMESLQGRAARDGRPSLAALAGAKEPDSADPALSPADVFDSLTAREFASSRQLEGLPKLQPKAGTQDFDLTGNARTLFDQVAQRFGLETVFDGDYPQGGQQIRFRIVGVDYREALHDLEAMTNSFVVPLSPRLVMVAQDTPQKRNDLEQTIAVSVPVPQALTAQELTEIGQAVKQATNIDKMAWDTAQGTILIRDRISRVLPAQALLNQLLGWRPQVMIDVDFLQATDSDVAQYGFNVTNSFPIVYLGQVLNSVPNIPSGVTGLLTFGGGKTLFGIGVAEAQALFNQTRTTTRSLYSSQMRSVAGQPVSFHVGEKYPVITQGFFGTVSPAQQGQVFQPPPSFTFENLGVTLKVTPYVHGVDAVTLTVESTFELLSGGSINGIPIFGQRQMSGTVRLDDGQWAIVAGITGKSRSRTTDGFWGLGQLPLIGILFKQHSKDDETLNVLIAIRPHLISLPPDQTATKAVRVGTETRPFTPL
jgi:type II secretory pathway component GspD/PulD (secretin)